MPDNHAVRGSWFGNPIWLLPIGVIAASVFVTQLLSGEPAPLHLTSTPLESSGANILENPSFAEGLQSWNTYHNAQPMEVIARNRSGRVEIRLGATTNSVQEVFQTLNDPPDRGVVATGFVRILGAALPRDAAVVVIFVDSTNQGVTKFSLSAQNGTGRFPFAFAFTPKGFARQFVLGVIVGKTSSPRTLVSFENLKVAVAKN